MAVDLTSTFHAALYVLAVECLLFFAVVMHSQTLDPGLHSGVARSFGLFFLFQALAAVFAAVAEQSFPSYFSQWFAVLAAASTACTVAMCVPAALEVAFPEERREGRAASLRVPAALLAVVVLALCALVLPGPVQALLDLPYVPVLLARKLLGLIAGGAVVLSAASAVRMARGLKGANGALILAVALVLLAVFGVIWATLEPICRQTGARDPFPASCPLPPYFDHNVLLAVLLMIANALAAEGVLRLMQAGDGVMGYTSIQV